MEASYPVDRVTRFAGDTIENYRFPGEMFTWRKRVTRLGEFSGGKRRDLAGRDEYFTM